MQGNTLGLKDNYDEQMQRLVAMCDDERLADREVTVTMRFAYMGPGIQRARTIAMRDRVEAALKEFGLTYTLTQDPESPFLSPVFVLFLAGPTRKILGFYQAVGEA